MTEETPETPRATIEREMRVKRSRQTTITVGDIKVDIIPVGVDGHEGWKVLMPAGGRIGHKDLTPKADSA